MIEWFKKLFSVSPVSPKPWGDPEIGLTRMKAGYTEFPVYGVMGHIENAGRTQSYRYKHYRYFCPCGTELTDGPEGGCAINAVCEKCRINYGCLPGYD